MTEVKILKSLIGEFVNAETVKEATQKEYNQQIWNRTVDSYLKYEDTRFFKTPGTIYPFDYYVIYIVDGIRFLTDISYSMSLTNGGYAYGFYTEGLKDKEVYKKLMETNPEFKDIDKDSLTILSHTAGRINTTDVARKYMRTETKKLVTRFFTKEF